MKAANLANRIAFLGTIGFNLSSAVVNASQVPLMFQPILGGRYGHKKAFMALLQAQKLIYGSGFGKGARKLTSATGNKIDVAGLPSIDNYYETDGDGNLSLRTDLKIDADRAKELEELKILIEKAAKRAQLNRSLVYDTIGLEEGAKARSAWDLVNVASAAAFHQVEKSNRQTAFIATYMLEIERLNTLAKNNPNSKEGKMTKIERKELAAEEALYQSLDMNGGSALATAPRLAGMPATRTAMMYKTYGVTMYATMAKIAKKAVDSNKTLSKEERDIARKQLAGIFISSGVLAGVAGMPMVGALLFIYDLFLTDDEEEDAETLLNRALTDFVYKGPASFVFRTDLSNRIGLSNLLFRNNPYNQDASLAEEMVTLFGGPAWCVFSQFYDGIGEINNEFGDTQRGIERMLPAAFRNFAKTYRYSDLDEGGIYTRRGDPIVDDVGPGGLLFQFIGFPPAAYTRKQEENQIAKGIDKAVNLKRSKLLRKLYIEMRHEHDIEDTLEELRKFNQKHPKFAITFDSLKKSIKQHARQSALMHNGVSLSPSMRRVVQDSDLYAGDDWSWFN